MTEHARHSEALDHAEAAAADAASDEKAEVLSRSKAKPGKPAKGARKTGGLLGRRKDWTEFEVHGWLTNFNSVEFGLYKHKRNMAKSRQFSTDMDIIAEVKTGGERTGLLGYREELWTKQSGMDKRLVMKLFSSEVNWQASMDLMLGRSLQLTLGARGLPVTAFSLNLGDHEQVVCLERSANKWPGMPENFSFFLLKDGRPKFYRLRKDLIAIGDDYTLYDEHGKMCGILDGRVLNLGGKWVVKISPEHADKQLDMVLKLFCGMLLFNDDVRHHLVDLAADVMKGKFVPKLEKQEADLYMNPRRVR